MAELKPICPINGMKCEGIACAWWCDFADCCAVPLVAGILADSSICQTAWNRREGDTNV